MIAAATSKALSIPVYTGGMESSHNLTSMLLVAGGSRSSAYDP